MNLSKAIINSVFGKFSTYIFQFLFLIIYSRIFTPEQFGLIATVQVLVFFLQLLSEMGIGPAIINQPELKSRQINGIFTFTILMGVVLSLLLILLSGPISLFYNEKDIEWVVKALALTTLFSSMTIVPLTAFIKDTKFTIIAKIDIFSEIFSFIIIYMIFHKGWSDNALVFKSVFFSMFRFFGTYFLINKTSFETLRIGSDLSALRSIYSFSIYQFSFNFINYFSRNLDSILIGKYFGVTALGLYDKSYQLMRYPLQLTTFAITPALQPVLTTKRDNLSYIVKQHDKISKLLFSLSIPIAIFIGLNSESIIIFLFGKNWVDAHVYVLILSFSIPVQAVMSSSGAFFQALNRPKLLFYTGLITSFINIAGIATGVLLDSVLVLSKLIVICFTINFFITYFILFRWVFNSSFYRFLFFVCRTIAVFLLPSSIFLFIQDITQIQGNNEFVKLCVSACCLVVFIPFIYKYLRTNNA